MLGSLLVKAASLVALFAFSYSAGFATLTILLLLAGLAASFMKERFRGPWSYLGGVVLVCFAGVFLIGPLPPEGHRFFEPGMGPAYQGGLVAAAVVVVLMLWELPGSRIYLRWGATMGLMLAAGVVRESFPFAYSIGLITILLLIFLRTQNSVQTVTAGSLAAGLLVLVLASVTAVGLKWAETKISFAAELFSGSSGSSVFSPSSDLRWAQRKQTSTRLVARVFTKKSPVHLAGMRYLNYAANRWTVEPGKSALVPEPKSLFAGRLVSFALSPMPSKPSTLKVELANLPALSLLQPNPVAAVGMGVERLNRGPMGTLYLPPQQAFTGTYWMITGQQISPPPEGELLEACLALPEDCPDQVHQLAKQLVATAPTKIAATKLVEGYFQENFEYGFGHQPKSGENILETFLRDKPAAHCEMFATATAMVLRAGGIPCRYVNGFLVAEQSNIGEYWSTRDRDAHAWVEAYIEGHGWVTVDPTPPAALDSPPVSRWRETFEWLAAEIRNSFRTLKSQPLDFLKTVPGAVLALMILWSLLRRVRWPKRSPKATESEPTDPRLSELQDLFHRFSEHQKSQGEPEKAGFTVLEWSRQLSPEKRLSREFLSTYSDIRYSHSIPEADQVERLRTLLERVLASKKDSKSDT